MEEVKAPASTDSAIGAALDPSDPVRVSSAAIRSERTGSCPACAAPGPTVSFVYALGRIQVRFPSVALEKEYRQVVKGADTAGLTDHEVEERVLSAPQNRYLARQLCWVLTIEGLETYLLIPQDAADFDLLLKAIRPAPSPLDVDLVIGRRGSLAPPSLCNGLMVPMVAVDQIYSFDRDTLLKSIPRPKDLPQKQDKQFAGIARDVFTRVMQLADNAGATDDHRAVNYLAVRYPAIYAAAADAVARDASLTSVDVRSSRLSGIRKILDVIFSFTSRQTGDVSERYFVRVDVTEEFPFLVTGMTPFFDR